MGDRPTYVRWFPELGIGDVAEVGGKNASLGELYRDLTPLGVLVPNGFAVTADAYQDTLTASGAWDRLREVLAGLDKGDVADLASRGRRAREIVYEAPLSAMAIVGAHRGGRHIGICGQGPSDFPDLAQRLVEFGIDSMSLNPDTVMRTRQIVAKVEARLESPAVPVAS